MLKVEHTKVYGLEAAIRGARNPLNSWNRMDSFEDADGMFVVGANDLELMSRLANAGPDHGKFMRMITVTCDVTAPIYWWKEYDTYKIGTVANSCSTMHKIHAKPIEVADFSVDHMTDVSLAEFRKFIDYIESVRLRYIESKDKADWYDLIQLLPSSYNQKRTVQVNYEVLKNMYRARKNHKLQEWHIFCDWVKTLPLAQELIIGVEA